VAGKIYRGEGEIGDLIFKENQNKIRKVKTRNYEIFKRTQGDEKVSEKG